MSRMLGTVSMGLRAPIIREGDDLVEIVTGSILEAMKEDGFTPRDRDVVAMTEAIVARAQGNYATTDDIAANDKIFVGIKCFTGSDHGIPPAGFFIVDRVIASQVSIAGESMFHQNGVIFFFGKSTVYFVTDIDVTEFCALIEGEGVCICCTEKEVRRSYHPYRVNGIILIQITPSLSYDTIRHKIRLK